MANVKTVISIDESLFRQVEEVSEEMHLSRSQLFALAVEELLQRRQNRKLLEALNGAYEDPLDDEEARRLKAAKRRYSEVLEDRW